MMTRREFLKMLGALGLASQLPPPLFERLAEAEPEVPVKPLVTVNELSVEAESVSVTQSIGHDFYLWGEIYQAYSPSGYEVEVTTHKPLAVEFGTVYTAKIQLPGEDFCLEAEVALKDRYADTWIIPDDRHKAPGFGSYRYLFQATKPPVMAITDNIHWPETQPTQEMVDDTVVTLEDLKNFWGHVK